DSDQRFGVRADWPLLASAIDKALASVTPAEALAIRRTWLGTRLDYGISAWDVAKWGGMIAAVVALAFAGVVLWHRRLRAEIVQRVAAEEALRASEKRLAGQLAIDETILANMDQGLVMVDAELRIEAYNTQYLRLFGVDPDLIETGMPYAEFLERAFGDRPEGREWIRIGMARAHLRESAVYQIEMNDGRTIEARQHPRDGGWVRTYTDITEMKRAEAAVRGRLEIEQLVSRISAAISTATDETLDACLGDVLRMLGEATDSDAVYVCPVTADGDAFEQRGAWHRPGVPRAAPVPPTIRRADLPWAFARLDA